jgi:choline dehydrogenase-like flavoprotein
MKEGADVLPDGHFLPPMGLTCSEWSFRETSKRKFGRTVTQGRCANLTQPLNGRQACHYCGPCELGCITHSYFNSSFTTLKDALKTGKCELITDAMVYKVLMSDDRASGVSYINRTSGQLNEVRARAVVLGASALESTRILLNSGVANSSGVLGHYYSDSLKGAGATAIVPDNLRKLTINSPHRPVGIYVIRFRNVPGQPQMKNFLRGYGFQGSSSYHFNADAPGFGDAYKKAAKEPSERFTLLGYGESLPRYENYVELDPKMKDKFGIPVLRMNIAWTDNERNLIKDAGEQAGEMLEAAGFKDVRTHADLHLPGDANHDVGTARMGSDPKKSVLNAYQQTHDVKNLFVVDGAGFNSAGCQNPTLTMMALAMRSSEYLMEEMRKGNI